MTEEDALNLIVTAIENLATTRGHPGVITNWALTYESTNIDAQSTIDIAAEGHTLAIPTLYQIGNERFLNIIEGDPA